MCKHCHLNNLWSHLLAYLSRLRSVCLRCSDLRLASALSGSSFLDVLLADSSWMSWSRWCTFSAPITESRTPRAISSSISLTLVDMAASNSQGNWSGRQDILYMLGYLLSQFVITRSIIFLKKYLYTVGWYDSNNDLPYLILLNVFCLKVCHL